MSLHSVSFVFFTNYSPSSLTVSAQFSSHFLLIFTNDFSNHIIFWIAAFPFDATKYEPESLQREESRLVMIKEHRSQRRLLLQQKMSETAWSAPPFLPNSPLLAYTLLYHPSHYFSFYVESHRLAARPMFLKCRQQNRERAQWGLRDISLPRRSAKPSEIFLFTSYFSLDRCDITRASCETHTSFRHLSHLVYNNFPALYRHSAVLAFSLTTSLINRILSMLLMRGRNLLVLHSA